MMTARDFRTSQSAGAVEVPFGTDDDTIFQEAGRRGDSTRATAKCRPVSNTPFQALHEIFEQRADARPDTVAVEFGRERLTYGRLERRANRLARLLLARGAGRGASFREDGVSDPLVAMWLPRSFDLYTALLGILKAGAAYVPIDPDCPPERVAYILENCGAAALVTTAELATQIPVFAGTVVRMDADQDEIRTQSCARLSRQDVCVGPRDLCYVIYTSGSTGRPKGVMIEHRSACHLVVAEARLFGVRPVDRVYQGFSLAFDASVEEVWLAFHAGATLLAATPEMAHAGPDLSQMLTEAGVTVLSCVPTLLAMLPEDVPTLRLLIVGGEACPAHLVERWARPGRRMVNTYGPTEATVIATHADLLPCQPVTIGRALPGYRVYLCDDGLRPVPCGEAGEIWIGGVGVARGYVGLPGTTEARFLPDPFAPPDELDARVYRTGDLGRINDEGELEFLGRADSQVKIRGFRVELAEIESVMMQDTQVRAAACALREDTPGAPQLVGYIVSSNGAVDEDHLRSLLRDRLPAYMMPALIEQVSELPKLPSGKLNRAALPAPRVRVEQQQETGKRPRTPTECRIAAVWETLFRPQPVGVDDDFFLDLGGHSLLAAQMVSELRKDPRFARVSMVDVYHHPTIARLAALFETPAGLGVRQSPAAFESASADQKRQRTATVQDAGALSADPGQSASESRSDAKERIRHFLAGTAQAGSLYFAYGFRAFQWVTPYLVYFMLLANGHSAALSVAWAAASAVMIFPFMLAVAVTVKWLVLGKIRAGRYPLWGGYYLRWWFVRNFVAALPLESLHSTPLLPFVYRLFGARIGRDVHIETAALAAFDLISIGDHTSVDNSTWLLGSSVESGELVVGPITIGRDCFIGTGSVLRENTVMGDGARMEDLSLLPTGARIPAGETWAGSPARPATNSEAPHPSRPKDAPLQRAAITAFYTVLSVVLPVLPLAVFVPGVAILTRINLYAHPFLYLAAAPVVGASFVVLLTAGMMIAKWLLVGRVRPGTYPVHGGFYLRKWIVDQLLALSLDTVGSLHATLYLPPWYRAMGAKLGKGVELSTATSATPDLVEIEDGGTIADEASLGASRIEGGWMTLARTHVGKRAFVGNGAVLAQGTKLGDGSLIGVLSLSPKHPTEAAQCGGAWMGSPPIALPRRQTSASFGDQRTYCPSRARWLTRGVVEILRITLPSAGMIMVTTTVVTAAIELWQRIGLGGALLWLPAIYAGCCAAVALAMVAAKWIVMGRYQAFERPLWSTFVWRLEFVNALYEFLVTPLALDAIQGTPFLPWYQRLLGSRVGRRVYLHTTGFLEWDLVEVGDEAMINEDCVLQTHLFEDRVLKASPLRIGRRCEIGTVSVVLYGSEMQDGARLDALSLLMKGEVLPAGTSWAGSPARRVER